MLSYLHEVAYSWGKPAGQQLGLTCGFATLSDQLQVPPQVEGRRKDWKSLIAPREGEDNAGEGELSQTKSTTPLFFAHQCLRWPCPN